LCPWDGRAPAERESNLRKRPTTSSRRAWYWATLSFFPDMTQAARASRCQQGKNERVIGTGAVTVRRRVRRCPRWSEGNVIDGVHTGEARVILALRL
jgi:hypothetical protein